MNKWSELSTLENTCLVYLFPVAIDFNFWIFWSYLGNWGTTPALLWFDSDNTHHCAKWLRADIAYRNAEKLLIYASWASNTPKMEIGILASGILSALAFWTVAYCPLSLCSLAFQHWRFVWLHFRHWHFGLWCFGYWHFSCGVLSGYQWLSILLDWLDIMATLS